MSDKCWVLLNDNGGQNMGNQSPYAPEFGLDGGAALGGGYRYADDAATIILPQPRPINKFNFVAGGATSGYNNFTNDFNCYASGYTSIQSRLWVYDVTNNESYFSGALPIQGSDIAMGTSTFITGCEYGINVRRKINDFGAGGTSSCPAPIFFGGGSAQNCDYTNLTLNQYSYNFSSDTAHSFSKIAVKTFRVVTSTGQLLGIGNAATAANAQPPSYAFPTDKSFLGSNYEGGNAGLGNSIGYISDTEVLVDDMAGNIWYVNLTDYYGGSTVFSHENGANTPHANIPYGPTVFNKPAIGTYPGPGHPHTLDNGWAVCSQDTNNKVYTVIGKKVIDLNWPHMQLGGTGELKPVHTQGDIVFLASDPSQGNQPTVAVTVVNHQPPGAAGAPTSNTALMPMGRSIVKYPIDLDNFIVQTTPFAQTPANIITGAALGNHITPPALFTANGDEIRSTGTNGIIKEPNTTNYYLLAQQQRFLSAITDEGNDSLGALYSPLNVDSIGSYLSYVFYHKNPGTGVISGPYNSDFGPAMLFGNIMSPKFICDNGSSISSGASAGVSMFPGQLDFRGGSQPPSCVFPSNYTYNCSSNGCESVFSSSTIPAGQFATLAECTGSCMSYSCDTTYYTCNEVAGTGATNTYLDPDDCGEFCVPPYYNCDDNGCTLGTLADHTFTSLVACQAVCVSHNCQANGCYPQGGTGGTFTNFATCTASCFSYVCGDLDGDGNSDCTLYNPPYYGSGGTFTGASLQNAYSACTAATATSVCTSWACGAGDVAPNTDIYVYYDSTSMSFANTKTAHNSMMNWSSLIPGWIGNIYHVNIADERWLSWAGIPFQQPTPRGLRTSWSISMNNGGSGYNSNSCPGANCCPRPFMVSAWGQSQPNGANWYDGFDPSIGSIFISSGSLAGTYQFKGYPPYAGGSFSSPDYSVPVLNVLFTDESDSPMVCNNPLNCNEFGTAQIYYDVNRVGVSTPKFSLVAANQLEPTPPFESDYNYWLQIWNTVSLNNGSVANFAYPTKPVNYSNWGSGTKMVFKHQALSVLAAISSGNMDQYLQPNGQPYALNGLWSAGTAPIISGTVGLIPSKCSIANLTELETYNPYWNSGFGALDQYGWGTNVSFPVINYSLLQADLASFITGGSDILATGCTSAATSTNVTYPYTSETACLDFCDPKWSCTSNGCVLNSTGGTYDSYSACTGGTLTQPACQSWSCTTIGCADYNLPLGGTGGTFTELLDCQTECTSWNCSYIPPSSPWTTEGCISYIGSGQTYSAESACTASCVSWDCTQNTPCTEYPNTGRTHSTEILCNGSTDCGWFQCQLGGCVAQVGTFIPGANNYITLPECKEECFAWGCPTTSIQEDTNIYAFYDTSSLTLQCVQNVHNSLMSWVNTLTNHTGSTYHIAIDDERWLGWGDIVHSGLSITGLQTPALLNNFQTSQVISWGATTQQSASWYDNQVPGTNFVPAIGNVTSKGLPPSATTSGSTLILCFVDESSGVSYIDNGAGKYHGSAGVVNDVPQFSGGSTTSEYQPTTAWTRDYTAWTNTYLSVSAATGTTLGFVYPTKCDNQISPQLNANMTFSLSVVASISPGDKPIKDGTWSASTYPRTLASGGQQGGTPPLCGVADLQMLSITNPYYSGGTGNLEDKGWGYNVDFQSFNSTQFQDDLGSFLTTTSSSVGVGACVSAETLWNTSITYPYSCETCSTVILPGGASYFEDNCCSCNCDEEELKYVCTTTGCSLSALGTLTWDQCNNPNFETPCVSWSCSTDTGCHDYNYPNPQMLLHNGLTSAPVGSVYPNPVGGTGGTFTILGDCNRLCTSYNCFWDPINMSIDQDGCLPQTGTGGTYYNTLQQTLGTDASYSACTGECISYECDNPCGTVSYPIPLPTGNPAPPLNPDYGCTKNPNTGSTHLTEISCTASCEEHWYCYTGDGITFLANCLNATSTGVINTSFEGQIAAIANNPTWQSTAFGNLRWDMTGNYFNPSPSNPTSTLPLPSNPCVATAGHWARIISVTSSITNYVPYYNWEEVIDGLNGVSSTNPQLNYSDTWQNAVNQAGPHIFCQWEWCNCNETECLIGCIDELPLPAYSHGSYTSSTAATEVCCTGATATTWSCQTESQASTCDGLTTLPGIYSSAVQAYDYVAINFGSSSVTGFVYEDVAPPIGTTICEGPTGGQLLTLTGLTLTNSPLQNTNYTSWSSFITALSTIPAPDGPVLGLVVGMAAATIELQIQSYSAFCSSNITYGISKCICTNTPCNCIELLDGTGPYTSQTECQTGNTIYPACCPTGTSWDCQSGIPFTPNCDTKDYLGMFNNKPNVIDHFITTSTLPNWPNTPFGLYKEVIITSTPLTYAQVQINMGALLNWQDCYFNLPGTQDYYPYMYVSHISHPSVNGGQTYSTWQSFSGAVTTAGVTFNSNDTSSTVCDKIDQQLGNTGSGFHCDIVTFECCRSEACYCYELFVPGGTYLTEPLCTPICCPPPPMGWECTPPQPPSTIGTCLFVPYGPDPTWNACMINCAGTTSWDCVPGVIQTIGVNSPNCGAATTVMNSGLPTDSISASEWALQNAPTIDYDMMYHLDANGFGSYTNPCVDSVYGYFYRYNIRPNFTNPGGIYDNTTFFNNPNWTDALNYLNTQYQTSGNGSQGTATPFNIAMTFPDIQQMMIDTCPFYGIAWDNPTTNISPRNMQTVGGQCTCTISNCDCVQVNGSTGQYPTYASCIPPCCQVQDPTYDCTINGCIDPGGGYGLFQGVSALQDCEAVCWEWVCNDNSVSSNCDNTIALEFYGNLQYIYAELNYTNSLPRTNVKVPTSSVPTPTVWQWAQPYQPGNVLIDFFGNPEKQYAPYDVFLNLVSGVYNMQTQVMSNYKMDTSIISPSSVLVGHPQDCSSPNGSWWKPTGIGVVDRTTGMIIVPPEDRWSSLMKVLITTYPSLDVQLGGGIVLALSHQPYKVNSLLLNLPVGFATLNGELRLYGEACQC